MGLSALAYARQLAQLLPRGGLWNFEPGSVLGKLLLGIADELARIDARSEDLVEEWDPRTAVELLPDWERALGLPDGCVGLASVVSERQLGVTAKLSARGGQTAAYYVALAAGMGFVAAVDEPAPLIWRLSVDLAQSTSPYQLRSSLFRAGSSRAGDRVAMSYVAELECVVGRAKPAHVLAWFRYLEEGV